MAVYVHRINNGQNHTHRKSLECTLLSAGHGVGGCSD